MMQLSVHAQFSLCILHWREINSEQQLKESTESLEIDDVLTSHISVTLHFLDYGCAIHKFLLEVGLLIVPCDFQVTF
jgi:hypothetical protein